MYRFLGGASQGAIVGAGRKITVDALRCLFAAAGAYPIGRGAPGERLARPADRPCCTTCGQAQLGRDEGLHGHHKAAAHMQGAVCIAGLVGRCAPNAAYWGCRAPLVPPLALRGFLGRRCLQPDPGVLARRPQERGGDGAQEGQAHGLQAMPRGRLRAYVHSQRSFIGFSHEDWLAARAGREGPGQAASAQPCDCVPQHVRRTLEIDPDNAQATAMASSREGLIHRGVRHREHQPVPAARHRRQRQRGTS